MKKTTPKVNKTIKIHDRFQLEIKRHYNLALKKKVNVYDIERYLFIPHSLDINKRTYSKEDFYRDIKLNLRFKTPQMLLKDIPSGFGKPLNRIKKDLHNLLIHADKKAVANYEAHLKMFCSIFNSSLREALSAIKKEKDPKKILRLIEDYISDIRTIIKVFRDLKNNLPTEYEKIKAMIIYQFGDEYISLRIEHHTYKLLEHIKNKDVAQKKICRKKLLSMIRSELDYRNMMKYPSVPDKEGNNEKLMFRKSILKKYILSALFLNLSFESPGKIIQHIIVGLAAGFAMAFATAVAFFSQYKYGVLTTPFFATLVLSYIFKDRIKEAIRMYLTNKVYPFLFDRKINIYMTGKKKIGYYKESFNFIRKCDIPKEVNKIRNLDPVVEVEKYWQGENVILYRKHIEIFAQKFDNNQFYSLVKAINDITRINVVRFIRKMDNPTKNIFIADKDTYYKTSAQRVYHLNLINRYSWGNGSRLNRWRIIMNREGIKRIEDIKF